MGDIQTRLNDLAHSYAGSHVSYSEFKWHREQFRSLKSLKNDRPLLIIRPDKGSGVVIMNYENYVDKITAILEDTTKLSKLSPVDTHDHTVSIETKFQNILIKWVKSGILTSTISVLIFWPINSVVYPHTYTNICGNKVNNNDDFNERTNTLLYKNIISHTLFSNG